MSACASYTCGCTCGAEHQKAPDGPPVRFSVKSWTSGTEVGNLMATCHTGKSFVSWWGGAHWVRADALLTKETT